jgi:hypothetical protein
MDMLDSFKGTWLYQAPGAIVAALGWLLPVLAVLASLLVLGLGILRYIAKGGGQYGIIEGYVGTIGAGKTTLAVQHALTLARARNAVLLSNIPVLCGRRCQDGEHVIEHGTLPVNDDGLDLETLTIRAFALRDQERGLVLLMDEVGVIMPARLWKDFSVSLMWVLQQSRKLACEWVWTAQDVSFVDHQLRSLTAVVHYVRAYPPPSIWRRSRGKRPWLLIASAFSPSHAPRANGETGARAAEKRIARTVRFYRRSWERSFDTDGVVLPSKHLKGAEMLVAAVERSQDRHVVSSSTSSWGPLAQGAEEPS